MNEWTYYVSLLPKFILLFCVFVPPNLIARSLCCNISNNGSCMASTILCSSFLRAVQFWNDGNSYMPSWHSNVVAWSKMRVVPRSVSDVVATSLFDVVKTLPQHCYNVATTSSIGFLGHFTTDYSDFFPFIEMRESYKSAKW